MPDLSAGQWIAVGIAGLILVGLVIKGIINQ